MGFISEYNELWYNFLLLIDMFCSNFKYIIIKITE